MRPQHSKHILAGKFDTFREDLCRQLALLFDLMLLGKVPSDVCSSVHGTTLTASKRKDGSIRSIAIGRTIRRIVAKIWSNGYKGLPGDALRPFQFGFGSKVGTEAVVHAARRFSTFQTMPPQALFKTDFKNAFNTLYRDRMLSAVADNIHEYLPFLSQAYEKPSWLLFGEHLMFSQCGIQQGYPLGPLIISLANPTPDSLLNVVVELMVPQTRHTRGQA